MSLLNLAKRLVTIIERANDIVPEVFEQDFKMTNGFVFEGIEGDKDLALPLLVRVTHLHNQRSKFRDVSLRGRC